MSEPVTAESLRELLHYCPETGVFARLYDYETMIEPGPQSIGNDFLGI